uniref:Uncharacterized protein n=1 Tax=Arundo donax TaxID=35708 RepID=A0A0A9BKQ9_ARUDO
MSTRNDEEVYRGGKRSIDMRNPLGAGKIVSFFQKEQRTLL